MGLLDDVAEVEVGKFKIVESHVGKRVVKLDGFREVGCYHRSVVGACTENGVEVVSGSIGVGDSAEGVLGSSVVLGEDLSKSSVVGFACAESFHSGSVVALSEVVNTESVAETIKTGSVAERAQGKKNLRLLHLRTVHQWSGQVRQRL